MRLSHSTEVLGQRRLQATCAALKMGCWVVLAVPLLGVSLLIGYSWIDRFDSAMIRGKRVLVTGASKGLGEQMAYHYARMGAKVMVTARSEGLLKRVVTECKRLSGHEEHYYIPADMGNLETIPNVVKAVESSLGALDILVLNHVTGYRMGWFTGKENLTDFERDVKINYHSYIHMAAHALPLLEKSPGSSIIVVSSVAGVIGFELGQDYASAKFGLHGFFTSLRSQFRFLKQDITVTMFFPGTINTEKSVASRANRFFWHEGTKTMTKFEIPEEWSVDQADTALVAIKAGALGESEAFYPFVYKYVTALFPRWLNDRVLDMYRFFV